jgi:anti-sigma regulatory factor (Ser/Thr protein kinase)
MRRDLAEHLVPGSVIDDAVLILSELLSNACRHARPIDGTEWSDTAEGTDRADRPDGPSLLAPAPAPTPTRPPHAPRTPRHLAPVRAGTASVLVSWELDPGGQLTVEVTDGGAATRPRRGNPSITAHGGRGLGIVGRLARDWGIRDAPGRVTVWAVLSVHDAGGALPGADGARNTA